MPTRTKPAPQASASAAGTLTSRDNRVRISLLAMIALMCCGAAFAQQQDVSIAVVKKDSIPTIELTNSHHLPIEAVAITSEHVGSQYLDTIVYDARLNYKSDILIQPGSSQQMRLPLIDAQDLPIPTLRAVIFSDGTTQGEEFWIQHLLTKRKVLVEALEKVMALFQDMIAQKLSRQQSLSALKAAWDERIRGYNGLAAEEREACERVFYSASSTLEFESSRYLTSAEDSDKPLSRVILGLNLWRANIKAAALVSSKPPRTLGHPSI